MRAGMRHKAVLARDAPYWQRRQRVAAVRLKLISMPPWRLGLPPLTSRALPAT